jgi:hypothetical protein
MSKPPLIEVWPKAISPLKNIRWGKNPFSSLVFNKSLRTYPKKEKG